MSGPRQPDLHQRLGPGGFVRLAYRLGLEAASGVLTLRVAPGAAPRHPGSDPGRSDADLGAAARPAADRRDVFGSRGAGPAVHLAADRPHVFVLRRGAAVSGGGELAPRALLTRLARAAAEPALVAAFEPGVAACPPGALPQIALASWARSHLERQLDAALADALTRELAGSRLAVRPELAPPPLDDADRRMLAALAVPRRLDQIWSLARAPRFRLLALLHVLRRVGALSVEAAATDRAADPRHAGAPRSVEPPGQRAADPRRFSAAPDPRRAAAMQLLGIEDPADLGAVKRAYRRLARTVHPDLQPGASAERRHHLERRFAELTAAYEALI